MKRTTILLSILITLCFSKGISQDLPTSSLSNNEGQKLWIAHQDNHKALYKVISNEAFMYLNKRKQVIKAIEDKNGWSEYQKILKEKYGSSLNKFSKTPLNVKVTGILNRDNFTVEKILFESHPGFYVTGCLFIPKKRQNPAPAVIYCSGHSEFGFRNDVYQHVIFNLVEKGFIVYAFDPIGQGERIQYPDDNTGLSRIGGPTAEHSYAGIQTLMTGSSISDYFIWDGVRAVDFLTTRKEVDINRIGITGRSGGGTQAALIAAYDDRIYAAAPECYITTFERLLESIGPQDAEQNPFMSIKKGINIPDLLHMRAPKPTLIVTTTNDYFNQQGALETFDELKRSYSAMGYSDNVEFTVDFGIHQSTQKNRETVYSFFQKHLNLPGDNTDKDIAPFKEEELWVTSTGKVGTSLGGNTVFDLNKKYFTKVSLPKDEIKEKVKELSGINFNRNYTAGVFTGKFIKEEIDITRYFIENDKKDYVLPLYVIKKMDKETGNLVVWLNPSGKEKLLDDPLLLQLLDAGNTVISADLPGTGELTDPEFNGDAFVRGVPFNYTIGANLVGKSIPGIQAEAIDLLMQFIDSKQPDKGKKVNALVQGSLVSSFLHYTTFKNHFTNILLLSSNEPVEYYLNTKYYDPEKAFSITPGSLVFYDMEDLISFLPETSVKVINMQEDEKTDRDNILIMSIFGK